MVSFLLIFMQFFVFYFKFFTNFFILASSKVRKITVKIEKYGNNY